MTKSDLCSQAQPLAEKSFTEVSVHSLKSKRNNVKFCIKSQDTDPFLSITARLRL